MAGINCNGSDGQTAMEVDELGAPDTKAQRHVERAADRAAKRRADRTGMRDCLEQGARERSTAHMRAAASDSMEQNFAWREQPAGGNKQWQAARRDNEPHLAGKDRQDQGMLIGPRNGDAGQCRVGGGPRRREDG